MNYLTSKLKRRDSSTTMCQTQAGKFATNEMATVDFCLSELNATKIVTRKFHVKDSTEIRYNIFLGIDLITALVLDLKFSGHIIIGGDGPYKGCLVTMVDVTDYELKPLTEILPNRKNHLLIQTSKNALSQKVLLVEPGDCIE